MKSKSERDKKDEKSIAKLMTKNKNDNAEKGETNKNERENGTIMGQTQRRSKSEELSEKFGNYKCDYCQYASAQKWILERHVAAVHFKICVCKKLCCNRCRSSDTPKNPYRYQPFRNWC